MSISKIVTWTVVGLSLLVTACSGGGSGGASGTDVTVLSVVQDLTADPDGLTTVLTLSAPVTRVDPENMEADGGQQPVSATLVDDVVTVLWNERVTPAHQVRISGVSAIDPSYVAVETSDDSVPSFGIENAQQVAGLGQDQITVAFAGPRVVESEAEELANWVVTVNDVAMDLTGSSFDFDPATQTLTIVTGPQCNLHSTFTLAASALHSVADVALDTGAVDGTASGDSSAPSLVSAEQNLSEDEYGRVLDFTFSEAMDPVFAVALAHFAGTDPDLSVAVEQPGPDVLRVTFNNPIVPGYDEITLQDLIDCAGNALPDVTTPIAAASTVDNDWATDPTLTTVANAGRDGLWIEFVQALDPDLASDAAHWELTIDGNVIDLATADFDYDLVAKTLQITLASDYTTGDAFHFAAAAGDLPRDVDGEDFSASFDGTLQGDTTVPTIVTVLQNRTFDDDGATLFVSFSEDVDESTAENAANWSVAGHVVQTVVRQNNGHTVRVAFDEACVPGLDTLDVSGVLDLAGNALAAVVGRALTSSDTTAPLGSNATATAVEGLDNDTLVVEFSDAMVAASVEDPANWTCESPIGTPIDLTNAAISYDATARSATVVFDADTGVDLQRADDFTVGWSAMLDLGGNAITSATLDGWVTAESTRPEIVSAWVDGALQNELHLRFSEPCAQLDDIAGLTAYAIHTNLGVLKGAAGSALVAADEMGVELTFGFAIVAGSDVLDCSGVLDTCGNPLFSVANLAIDAEDTAEVALDIGLSSVTAQSGEANDVVTMVFDRRPSPWNLLDSDHYTLELLGTPIDLSSASFAWDGDVTLTITLDGFGAESVLNGSTYDLTISGLQSAQGVDMSGVFSDTATAAGDAVAPTLPNGAAKLDAADPAGSVLIQMDEALSAADAADTSLVLLNGAINPDSCELLGYRTVRATFSGGVVLGDTLDVQYHDLAGNLGLQTRTLAAADVAGPLVVTVAGTAVAGDGGDFIEIVFNKQVDLVSALANSHYTLVAAGASVDVSNAALNWNSSTQTMTMLLPTGTHLVYGSAITVGVSDVLDHAGLTMSPAAAVGGTVGGDATAPDFAAAFVNLRGDVAGSIVDVLFDEDVAPSFVADTGNWVCSGGQLVLALESLTGSHWRLELSAPLGAGETLDLVGLPDLAGNVSGAVSIEPLQ